MLLPAWGGPSRLQLLAVQLAEVESGDTRALVVAELGESAAFAVGAFDEPSAISSRGS